MNTRERKKKSLQGSMHVVSASIFKQSFSTLIIFMGIGAYFLFFLFLNSLSGLVSSTCFWFKVCFAFLVKKLNWV